MLKEKLQEYNIILGSSSPRRKKLLKELQIKFKVQICHHEEIYSHRLKEKKVAEFLAQQKSFYLSEKLKKDDLIITADTIVVLKNTILNKPKNQTDAFNILTKLSNRTHKVITGVFIRTVKQNILFSTTTKVTFKKLSNEEINFYINNYKIKDKAGSYGIQDWIGKIGVISIEGSYTNVLGLPLTELYENLKKIK
tara:strand:- start:3182 stop:3766 length:585 start_codon:yes stop_codon:yes gene_type:complete